MLLTTPAMAGATFLTTRFHRRPLRHVWLIVGVVGSAACTWWLTSMGNFTPKERIALNLTCWGAFLVLMPPAFLSDEVEALNPKDALYALTLSVVGLITPIIMVPTMTGTVIKVWSDRALDTYRLNLSGNRPAVPQAADRVGEYFRQRGLGGPAARHETDTVLGTFATLESDAVGFQSGLRFLSLMMLTLGLTIALLLWRAARNLGAPPGAGYT
jgi:hypothetical protein